MLTRVDCDSGDAALSFEMCGHLCAGNVVDTARFSPLGSAFLRAEREQGINARYLVAHAMLESGWGSSDIARLKRNLFGFNAYDRDPWRYATRFASHARGVAAVAAFLDEFYLTPGGRWWYRFTTPRAINRYYASDPRWADKVANIANIIDDLVVTLRERRVRFQPPALGGAPQAGAPAVLTVPWRSSPGATLPAALRFAARWIPLAIVEASAEAPTTAAGGPWRFVPRTDGRNQVVRLGLTVPAVPGLYRLEVEARDSDGQPLPATDRPPVPALVVRVPAAGEIVVALGVGEGGDLAATVAMAGAPATVAVTGAARVAPAGLESPAPQPTGLPAGAAATPGPTPATADPAAAIRALTAGAVLELWTLPLDPAADAYRQARVALPDTFGPATPWTVPLGAPSAPAVVVARIVDGRGSGLRSVPFAVLARRDDDGRLTITPLRVASPRDDALFERQPAAAPIVLRASDEPGSLVAEVAGTGAPSPGVGEPAPGGPTPSATPQPPGSGLGVAGTENPLPPRLLVVRSLAAEATRTATPMLSASPLPPAGPDPTRVTITGLPGGVRLVVAGLVPPDGGPVDPATLALAWIAVAAPPGTTADPN